jgi:Uncharacterized conserved protein (DUF2190)
MIPRVYPDPTQFLRWNSQDGTLDVEMGLDGVTQQVGLEQYMVMANNTGSTLLNGKVIGFAGSTDGRIEGQKYIADGSMPSIYCVGVATMDILDGKEGYVTTYGYVRDMDTSAWSAGDVLYASPDTAGELTNVKPTVPNITVPVAAVVTSDATVGVIMVRPTHSIPLYYGSFSDTTSQNIAAVNTPQAVTFNTTDVSNGVSRGSPTSRIVCANSGLYNFQFSIQLQSSSASQKDIYLWPRINGTDVANSATIVTISGSGTKLVPAWNFNLTLAAGQYFELMIASDSTAVSLYHQVAQTSPFALPAIPSVILTVNQINQ